MHGTNSCIKKDFPLYGLPLAALVMKWVKLNHYIYIDGSWMLWAGFPYTYPNTFAYTKTYAFTYTLTYTHAHSKAHTYTHADRKSIFMLFSFPLRESLDLLIRGL